MSGFIHIIQQYCNHRLPAREDEYRFCVRRNLENPHVAKVHNLVDSKTAVPEEFRRHHKYVECVQPSSWITFRQALDYANSQLSSEVACISNLDIFLDPSCDWPAVKDLLKRGLVLCLSRTEIDAFGNAYKDPAFARLAHANTQDVWLFHPPFDVPDCDFDIGTLGCDNAFAHRIKQAGRLPLNSPNRFRVFHYDHVRGKTAANQQHIHSQARAERGNPHPEEQGQYLLPDIDQVGSLDALAGALGLDELRRYSIACDMMSDAIRIRNR